VLTLLLMMLAASGALLTPPRLHRQQTDRCC
jgi:hypothetical protein